MTEQEFKIRVLPYSKTVFPLAKRMLVSDELARDALQLSMLKLWEKRQQLSRYTNLKAFVFKVVKNVCLDELKRKKTIGMDNIGRLNVRDESHDRQFEDKETVELVMKAIAGLSPVQAEVIQLRDIDGLEFDEIASILEQDVAYVRVLLSRARKTVREKIEKMNDYESKEK